MATVAKRTWTNKSGTHTAWRLSYTDAKGKRHKEQFPTKREAEDRRVEVEGQVRKGTFRPDATKVTVSEVAGDYLLMMADRRDRREKVTATYYDLIEGIIRNYIDPTDESRTGFKDGVGSYKLAQLTARAVSDFRDRIRNAGVTPYHARRILGVLSRILDYAIGQDLVAVNVARTVKVVGRRDETSKRVTPPPKAALQELLRKSDEPTGMRIRFAASTGLRASEQWAARWRHMDLEAGRITVETRVDKYGDEDTTKTLAGVRSVPLGAGLVKALKEWRKSSPHKGDDDLVFPNAKGKHTNHVNFLHRKFDPLRLPDEEKPDAADLTEVTWHALRHYAVSTWIEAGLAPKTVQTFAGHSSLAVTMDRYGHLFPSDDHKAAMDKISEGLFD
jgi:integrase